MKKVIVIFGAPCSGKGTISKKLEEVFKLKRISTGDLVREEIKNQTKFGLYAEKMVSMGKYVSDGVFIPMIHEIIIKEDNAAGFIFDGYPRTTEQAKQLEKFFFERRQRVTHAFLLEVSQKVLLERMISRAEKEQRLDDNDTIFKERIDQYNSLTKPMLEYFKDKLKKINGSLDAETVTNDILKYLS